MSGTVAQAGTTIFVAGTASGIDTAALIDAAVQQKNIRAVRLEVEVDENSTTIGAYAELEGLTQALEASLDQLRGPEGLFDTTERAFDQRSGTVSTSDGSDFSSIVDISITSDAVKGNYEIEVTQAAEAQRVIGTSVADENADLGFTGTFDLGLSGGGTTATINVTADLSLSELATAINAESATTGIEASVLKVSETEFRLVLTGQETNRSIEVTGVTGDDALNNVGVTDGVGGFQNELQAAQGAIIQFDGVTVTRDDNNFDDLVAGIELNINNASPGTIISLEVDNDVTAAKDAITSFIDSYNAVRDFIVQNQQVSTSGEVAENAALFGDNLLSGVADTLSSILADNFGNGSSIATIRDLGISIGSNNRLEIFDEAVLDNALLTDFDNVRAAFASGSTSDNSEFALVQNTSSAVSQAIVFDLTTDGAGTITGVTANGDGSAFTVSGNTVIGAIGTIYEGLVFSYQGTDLNVTINTNITQGLADRIINGLDGYTNSVNGLIVQEKLALQDENTEKLADAQEIRDNAEVFRLREIEKFAEFEAQLQALEILKDQIRAILGNNNDDDN